MLNENPAFVNSVTYGAFEHTMLEYQQWHGVSTVKICVAPDACDPCRKLAGRTYPLAEAPSLPCRDCANPAGCRCRVMAVDMEWNN